VRFVPPSKIQVKERVFTMNMSPGFRLTRESGYPGNWAQANLDSRVRGNDASSRLPMEGFPSMGVRKIMIHFVVRSHLLMEHTCNTTVASGIACDTNQTNSPRGTKL
jgi:hypothetical protein